MPAKSAKQYGLMQAAAHGAIMGSEKPTRAVAKEFVNKTPKAKRSAFSQALKKKKVKK